MNAESSAAERDAVQKLARGSFLSRFKRSRTPLKLAAVPRDVFRPLVVLDVNRPWGSEDAISYLLLRNAFAGDLFALGRCAGVLGTGLAGDGGYELCDAMISALAAGRSLGEVAGGLRSPARHATGLDRVLPSAGVALHTHLPWLRLVPDPGGPP